MDSRQNLLHAFGLLNWHIELGVTEAIGDAPVDRYALDPGAPKGTSQTVPSAPMLVHHDDKIDPVAEARVMAHAASDLEALRSAMAIYTRCDLKKGARSLVFSDGVPGARVMIVGEAPGRDEDREGRPFVGRAGKLLDRMLGAIGLDRAQSIYITNVLPWRPPENRDPKPGEIAMMTPFLERHVALAAPDVLVLMGNISCQTVLGRRGITRLRGQWTKAMGRSTLPMFHPAYLLRQPHAKRAAWADLLSLQARLDERT
ncbi:MAG: uracil-DNA glycosylase [Rhodobacteraceae bacterium]|nr:uracil-DNA glycosylase [Paracoccaceae bacterium]